MYSLPQEIEVWYIIPTIRKELARLLTKKHKLTFERAGKILGISKSAVSQYINKKRADMLKITPKIRKDIEKSSNIIIKNENLAVKEILRILALMKKQKCSCKICKKFNKGILSQCGMNPVKGE